MSDDFKGRGGSPWGTPPGGGGNGSGRGPTPPDIDAIIKDIQNIDKSPKEYHLYNFGKLEHTLESILSI